MRYTRCAGMGRDLEEVKLLVACSCPTLFNPMDCSPPGSSVHGILQAGILKWVAMPFSRGIFPTRGLNHSLLHCRRVLYHLSRQGSPLRNVKEGPGKSSLHGKLTHDLVALQVRIFMHLP